MRINPPPLFEKRKLSKKGSFRLSKSSKKWWGVNPYIFRAYDIRGIYKKDIDEELFFKIGFILGKAKRKFVVGNDIRKSGKKLARALGEGLTFAKAKTIYTGTTSFGQTLFAGWKLKAYKTLFVTASHLPPEWNGLKIYYGNGIPISEKEIQTIKEKVLKLGNQKGKKRKPQVKKIDPKKDYLQFFLDKFSHLKRNNLKLVLDCGNGSMCLSAPEVFKKLGFNLSEIFCKPDPDFPNRQSEPTFEATKFLREKVVSKKADFGVAFDGDGDRAVIIDDKGRYLKGDVVGMIIAKNILKISKNKKIVATLPCSMALEKELKDAKIKRVQVGHTFLVLNCKKERAIFGVEESSHFCFPQYFWFDDAILVPLKISEILIKEKKKLSQIVDEIKIYPFEEIKFNCLDEIKFKVIKDLKDEFKKEYSKVTTIDGVRVNFDFGWILIRASNTSPIIRLYVEAENKEKLENLKEKFSKVLKEKIYEGSNFGSR